MIIERPQLKGVVTYINHASQDHAITFFFKVSRVEGELETKESDKHIPQWVDLDTLHTNEEIPDYYRAFIRALFTGETMLNARVEWHRTDGKQFEWHIER